MQNHITVEKGSFGFTLAEVLMGLTIMAILLTVASVSYQQVRRNVRDGQRIVTLSAMKKILAQYYSVHGHYPPAWSSDTQQWEYVGPGSCGGTPWDGTVGGTGDGLRWNNSFGAGIIEGLFMNPADTYMSKGFNDPFSGVAGGDQYYWCRYIIPMTSHAVGVDEYLGPAYDSWYCGGSPGHANRDGVTCPHPDEWKEIQKYYIHCSLETKFSEGKNDGGIVCPGGVSEAVYEVFEPSPWLAIDDAPN